MNPFRFSICYVLFNYLLRFQIIEQETELDKAYMSSILTDERTELDKNLQLYTNLINKIILVIV